MVQTDKQTHTHLGNVVPLVWNMGLLNPSPNNGLEHKLTAQLDLYCFPGLLSYLCVEIERVEAGEGESLNKLRYVSD